MIFDNLAASYWLLASSQTEVVQLYANLGRPGMKWGDREGSADMAESARDSEEPAGEGACAPQVFGGAQARVPVPQNLRTYANLG